MSLPTLRMCLRLRRLKLLAPIGHVGGRPKWRSGHHSRLYSATVANWYAPRPALCWPAHASAQPVQSAGSANVRAEGLSAEPAWGVQVALLEAAC
jgi:hypothetical protein